MAVVTTRPNATVSSSDFAASGAANRHAATSDDSDASYILGNTIGDSVMLGFAEPSIPAGGLVKSVAVRARVAKTSGSPVVRVWLYTDSAGGTHLAMLSFSPTNSIPTIITVVPATVFSTTPSNVNVALYQLASGEINVYELYVDTVYVAKPVTAPSAPTGTVTATNIPTVEWANTLDTDGGDQTHYQVRVFTAAQYGAGGFDAATSDATYDSGIVTGDSDAVAGSQAFHAITTPLADATYRAYVRVAQTVNGTTHWSDYAYTGFTIDVDLPAVPDVTPTADVGAIAVYTEENSGGAATTDYLEVQRSEDGGTTWEACRTLRTDGLVEGPFDTVYDYEAPNGTLMSYRARALHEVSAGNLVASAWTSTATATWTSSSWWLKCPEHPSLNMVVVPDSIPSYQRPARHGVFQALGSADTVIVADKRGAPRGTMRLQIDTAAERDDLDALLDANATLLLQGPPAHHWPDRYLRIGDQDRARWIDKAWVEPVVDTLPWWEVARPDGVVVAWPA